MSGKSGILCRVLVVLLILIAADVQAAASRVTAFVHANLISMTADVVLPDHTVVIQGDRIAACGPSGRTTLPAGARVIDCRHAFLMPGLADMHMHLRYDWIGDVWPVSPLKLYLAHGVTTVRCFGPRGKTGRYGLTWRKQIAAGRLAGPTIITCGPQLRGHFRQDPEQIVIRQKYQGFDFIKLYSYVTRQEYQSIMSAANDLNMYTAGHIPFQVGLDGVLDAGLDEIAHIEELLWELSSFDRSRYFESEGEWMNYVIRETFGGLSPLLNLSDREQEIRIREMAAELVGKFNGRSIPVCTTLVIDDLIVQKLYEPERFLARPENRYLPARYLERFRQGRDKHQLQFNGGEVFAGLKYKLDKALLKSLKAVGTPLLLATDAGTGWMGAVPGRSIHDELRILVDNGFTPFEALASGTVVASRIVERMNGRDEFGTIVPGKRADLVLLEKNPLAEVSNARVILGVMAAGRWYDREAIASMLTEHGGVNPR
jgi:hypothetical protein